MFSASGRATINRDQARRVAWRILKDWTEAQMVLVESNQVSLHQVMMPYQQVAKGLSLYDHLLAEGSALSTFWKVRRK